MWRIKKCVSSETAEQLRQFQADFEYFHGNYDSLAEQYPDRWVAVYQQQIVGADKDLERLIHDLRRQELPTGNIFVDRTYFNERRPTLILSYSTA